MGNRRIAANAIFTASHSLIAMLCGLFAGRWLLNALGMEGFGALSVVGGLMSFILLFNNVLTSSASRHFAYAIGKSEKMSEGERIVTMGEWFAASFFVHVALSLLLCGIGVIVGEWYIAKKLIVIEELRGQCFWVFRFALISAFFAIISAPYFALYEARQMIFVRTVFSIGATILNAAGTYALFFFTSQRLFFHSLIAVSIQIFTTIAIIMFATFHFPETHRLFMGTKRKYFKSLFAFGGAQMFGIFANMVRDQGNALVINLFSGAKANAGWGIGRQVTSKASFFATATMGAILPEVTTCLSSGRRERAFNIAEKLNLFVPASYTLVIFPVLVNLHAILHLWLGSVPIYAAEFCGVTLFYMYIDALTGGYQQLINANGKILSYQLSMGIAVASSVLVVTLFCKLDFPIDRAIVLGILVTTILTIPLRLLFMKYLFGVLLVNQWLRRCFIPNIFSLVVSFAVCYFSRRAIGSGLWQFCALGVINVLFVGLSIFLLASCDNRDFMLRYICKFLRRFGLAKQ